MTFELYSDDDFELDAIANGSLMSREDLEQEVDSFYGQDERLVEPTGGADGVSSGPTHDTTRRKVGVDIDDSNNDTSMTSKLKTSELFHLTTAKEANNFPTVADGFTNLAGGMEHMTKKDEASRIDTQNHPHFRLNSNFSFTHQAVTHVHSNPPPGRVTAVSDRRVDFVTAHQDITHTLPPSRPSTADDKIEYDLSTAVVALGESNTPWPQAAEMSTRQRSPQGLAVQPPTFDFHFPAPAPHTDEQLSGLQPHMRIAAAAEDHVKQEVALPDTPAPVSIDTPIMIATSGIDIPSSEGKSSLYEDMHREENPPREKNRIAPLHLISLLDCPEDFRPSDKRLRGVLDVAPLQPSGRLVVAAATGAHSTKSAAGVLPKAADMPRRLDANTLEDLEGNRHLAAAQHSLKNPEPAANKHVGKFRLREVFDDEDELSLANTEKQSGPAPQVAAVRSNLRKEATVVSNASRKSSERSPPRKQRRLDHEHITTTPLRDQEPVRRPQFEVSRQIERTMDLEETTGQAAEVHTTASKTQEEAQVATLPIPRQQPRQRGRGGRARGGRELAGLVDEWNKPQLTQTGGAEDQNGSVQQEDRKPVGGHRLGKRELAHLVDEWNKAAAPQPPKKGTARSTRAQDKGAPEMPNARLDVKARRQGK